MVVLPKMFRQGIRVVLDQSLPVFSIAYKTTQARRGSRVVPGVPRHHPRFGHVVEHM